MKNKLIIFLAAVVFLLAGCDSSEDIALDKAKAPSAEVAITGSIDLEGKYQLLEKPFTDLPSHRPFVIEFFWFGCPHCYSLDPLVQAFKRDNSEFEIVLIPAAPNPRWEIEARLYYAMQALGVLDRYFAPVFQLYADQREKKRSPPSLDALAQLMGDAGITKEQLAQSMKSGAVDQKIAYSNKLFDQADLTGVPSLIVNGKYKLDLGGLDPKNFVEDFNQTLRALGEKP